MSDIPNDRLLSEKAILKLAYERFGLGAIKVVELLRDVETANALTVKFPDMDRRKANNE